MFLASASRGTRSCATGLFRHRIFTPANQHHFVEAFFHVQHRREGLAMATQNDRGAPFFFNHMQQSFRLLELPPELLQLVSSDRPPV
jgi:hypothetical protein